MISYPIKLQVLLSTRDCAQGDDVTTGGLVFPAICVSPHPSTILAFLKAARVLRQPRPDRVLRRRAGLKDRQADLAS
jgi:hypothetical protein